MVQSLLLYVGFLSLGVLFFAYGCILLRLANRPRAKDEELFGVSILKPLKGVDEGLRDNLLAILNQDHPHFEVVFGCEDPEDPALEVVREIAAQHPELTIKIVAGGAYPGMNPKVRILRRLLEEASHEWILISDSNVRPAEGYLRAMQARQMEEKADLVHSVLSGVHGRSLGGRLEELQLNGWVAASICFSDIMGHPCVIGKSMLLRREALEAVGGLPSVKDILAEDYILGTRLHRAGRKVALSSFALPVVTGNSGLGHFFNRHVRWGQMRRRISPFFFVAELSANPTPFFMMLAIVGDPEFRAVALIAQAVKWACDASIYFLLARRPSWRTVSLMPLKDALIPVMWVQSAIIRTVNWRGNRMLVGPGSKLIPIKQEDSRSLFRRVIARV